MPRAAALLAAALIVAAAPAKPNAGMSAKIITRTAMV